MSAPTPEPVEDSSTEDRIILWCVVCPAGINVPNHEAGRGVAAWWRTQHEGEQATHD